MSRVGCYVIAGTCNRSGIEEILIDQEDLVLVVDPKVAQGRSIEQLFEEYPFITYDIEGVIKECLNEINCKPNATVECGSEEEISELLLRRLDLR